MRSGQLPDGILFLGRQLHFLAAEHEFLQDHELGFVPLQVVLFAGDFQLLQAHHLRRAKAFLDKGADALKLLLHFLELALGQVDGAFLSSTSTL